MNVGILGTGFGMHHANIYKKIDAVDSITVFGRNKEKLEKISKDTGLAATDNADSILTDKNIDLVDICLPSSIHKEYVTEALKNGKNVFCETPICLSLEDALAMQEAEEQYGRRVFVNMFIRHEYPYKFIYDTAKDNTLGKLKALHLKRETPPLWGDLSLKNIVTNLMIHEFDFMTWLLGIPNKICSSGINGKAGQSHVNASFVYEDTIVEVQGSSMMPLSYPFTVAFEAVFERGTVEYIQNSYSDREESSFSLFTDSNKETLKVPDYNHCEQSIKHVVECCTKGTPTIMSLDDAIISLKVAMQVKDSLLKE